MKYLSPTHYGHQSCNSRNENSDLQEMVIYLREKKEKKFLSCLDFLDEVLYFYLLLN